MAGWGGARRQYQCCEQISQAGARIGLDLTEALRGVAEEERKTCCLNGGTGFPGILDILNDRFEASSEGYREWLTEYMSPVECPACHGQRLKPASLAVRVKNFAIAEFTGCPLRARCELCATGNSTSARRRLRDACWTRSGVGWNFCRRWDWTI